MIFQMITIDVNQILEFASGSPLTVLGRLFIFGGWIPIVFVILWGLKEAWLNWRMDLAAAKAKYVLLAIDVPKENEQLPKAVENVFVHIHGASVSIDFFEKWWKGKMQPNFSFEICSHGGYVQFYIRTEIRFRNLVESAVFSQYPDAEINEVDDYAKQFKDIKFPPTTPESIDVFGCEYKLSKPDYLPIRTYLDFEEKLAGEFKDPLSTLLESLSKIRPEEQIWLQFLAKPADGEWKEAGTKYIKKIAGIKETPKPSTMGNIVDMPMKLISDALVHGSVLPASEAPKKKDDTAMFKMLMMTPDTKATLEGVATKITKPGFGVKIRFVYLAPKQLKFVPGVFPAIKGALNQFNALGMNKFGPYDQSITKDDYFWLRWSLDDKKRKILGRYIRRSGDGGPRSILNVEELASLYHFPIIATKAPLIKKTESRRAEPPARLPTLAADTISGAGAWSKLSKPPKAAPPASTPSDKPPGAIPFV